METIDFLAPFISLGMVKYRQEENIVHNHNQEYYGIGVNLVPVKVLPWKEYIEKYKDNI